MVSLAPIPEAVNNPRKLDITDLERIDRYKRAGYGGSVADALMRCGVRDTSLSADFQPLRPDTIVAGRAMPIRSHKVADHQRFDDNWVSAQGEYWESRGGHPQKRMMQRIREREDGVILCFDASGDTEPAHFGEMSAQLAQAYGARGMVLAGNARDTRYVSKMTDFPVFAFGTRPVATGGWIIAEFDEPIYLPGHMKHNVRVNADDFIFGDSDGVLVIPAAYVDEVLLQVEDTFEEENAEREQLAAGIPIDEVYRRYGVL